MSSDSDAGNTMMEGFLRNWRQTAFNAGQFQTAIFVGDKLLALTSQSLHLALRLSSGLALH